MIREIIIEKTVYVKKHLTSFVETILVGPWE